jgi:transketolase
MSTVGELKKLSNDMRRDIVNMICQSDAKSGHFGGSLSAAEYIAVLYWEILNVDPGNPQWPQRDRVVFSKGHSAPVLYSALARKGYFDMEVLGTYRNYNSILQGHPDMRKTPGLDSSSGSLGQGLSVALGMALACRHNNMDYKVYCVLSDGEMQEGMVWEAFMAAAHHKANNLTVILDYNRMHVTGATEDVMELEPLEDKIRAFGWHCVTVDGHDIESILAGFKLRESHADKPFALICKTIKGKGISFMENSIDWHCNSISESTREEAVRELSCG